jgi:hypothetical protein
VPDGNYLVAAFLTDLDEEGEPVNVTLAIEPQIAVTGDRTVLLDARRGKRATASVEGFTTRPLPLETAYHRVDTFGVNVSAGYVQDRNTPLYLQPTVPVTVGRLETTTRWRLAPTATNPVLVDLLFPEEGRIPPAPRYAVSQRELRENFARVDNSFHRLGDTLRYHEGRAGFTPLTTAAVVVGDEITVPQRTEYVGGRGSLEWAQSVERNDTRIKDSPSDSPFTGIQLTLTEPRQAYRKGEHQQHTWFAAPLHPSIAAPADATRDQHSMRFSVSDYTDADNHGSRLDWSEPVVQSALRLYRDGQQVFAGTDPGAQVPVPTAAARYRLERDVDTAGLLPLSTATRTRWTFPSKAPAHGASAPLPLLLVDYDLPVDRDGTANGRTIRFTLRTNGAAKPDKGSTATFAYSTDDGRTWKSLPAAALGAGRFSVTMPGITPGLYVSLRISGANASGAAVDQTVIRTYLG